MKIWFSRLLSSSKSGALPSSEKPAGAAHPVADSVAQRRRGNQFLDQGDLSQAIACYQNAVASDPNSGDAHTSLGYAHKEVGEFAAAQTAFQRAVELQPDSFDPVYLLGQTCMELCLHEKAAICFEKAFSLKPEFESLYGELCQALFEIKSMGKARQVIRSGIERYPTNASFHFFLGNLHSFAEEWQEANFCYETALNLEPNLVLALNNQGNVLKSLGRFSLAERSYRAALSIDPDFEACLSNLGGTLLAQGRLSEAALSLRRAIEINPNYTAAHSNLLYTLSVDSAIPRQQYLSEAVAFGNRLKSIVGRAFEDWLVSLDTAHERPLRIGLVSGSFRNHPVGFFLESVLASIDPARLELIAYASNSKSDELTTRIRPYFAQWNNVFGMEEAKIAEKIRADGVHTLVDLNGHSEGNLLTVFALKPAPVQVSWLGYWASTGVSAIDYILADETTLPPADQVFFTESVHYLQDTRFCFAASKPELRIGSLPVSQNGYLTFACFQARNKVTARVLAVWGQILRAIPNARLRLASNQVDDADSLQEFLDRLRIAGLDTDRVAIAGPVSREKYLASYGLVDIVLDTFPYTGGTTTCEALWMGVPTLTLCGDTMIARQGAGMINCVGLDDWVARDEADYVAKAISHAKDIAGLTDLRTGLRARALASPLFDAPKFARNLEDAFSAMWQQKMNPARESLPVPGASEIDSSNNF